MSEKPIALGEYRYAELKATMARKFVAEWEGAFLDDAPRRLVELRAAHVEGNAGRLRRAVIRPPGVGIYRPVQGLAKGVSKDPVDGVCSHAAARI